MVNITKEADEILTEEDISRFLKSYGSVEIYKPIKDKQGKKSAKENYAVFLYSNSSLEDKKFIEFCKKNRVMINLDISSEW